MPFRRSTQPVSALLVQVHDHLGVGVRREAMPARFELGAQLGEVVDLAVEHDLHASRPRSPIGWLPDSRSMIDEPAEAQTDSHAVFVLAGEEALVVGPAVAQGAASSDAAPRGRPGSRADHSADPAHREVRRYESGACSSKFVRSRTW